MSKAKRVPTGELVRRGLLPRSFGGQRSGGRTNNSFFSQDSDWAGWLNTAMNLNERISGNPLWTAGMILNGLRNGNNAMRSGMTSSSTTVSGESKGAARRSGVNTTERVITKPVVAGSVEMNAGPRVRLGAAPRISGYSEAGVRLTVSFAGPNLVQAPNTYSGTPSAAWQMPQGAGTLPNQVFQALQLNPAEDTYSWGLSDNAGTNTVSFAPLFYCVPKLACFARCFSRYHISQVSLRTTARLGSETNGTFVVGYVHDAGKVLEIPDLGAVSDNGETAFRWTADLERSLKAPIWTAETEHVVFRAPTPTCEADLQYTTEGISSQPGAGFYLVGSDMRFNTPGAIVAQQDLGLSSNANPVQLRRTFFTVSLDLYGMAVGTPYISALRGETKETLHRQLVYAGPNEFKFKQLSRAQESKAADDSNPHDEWSVVSGPKSASVEMRELTKPASRVDAGKSIQQATPRSLSLK